jgi:CRP/FNR family transcriptional regulator, cyclic AMP receptor protein
LSLLSTSGTRTPHGSISLCAHDPDLVRGIPAPDLPLARRVLVAPRMDLPTAPWRPGPSPSGDGVAPSLLITRGLLASNVLLAGRTATQLFGPGDVIDPWATSGDDRPRVEWVVHEDVIAAVLDVRFAAAARRWPSLSAVVHDRMRLMAGRLCAQIAICQLARVDQRVIALLWELADRFGRVTPDGVVLDVRLTHALMGRLIGAKRPTVTLAIGELVDRGALSRRHDGAWILHREASEPVGWPLGASPSAELVAA